MLVDTLGLLVAVLVTAANLDDGTAAPQLLARITTEDCPRLKTIFGDNKYHNHALNAWLAEQRPTWKMEIQSRPEGAAKFAPVRKRWVVERTNAWTVRCRCNAKDSERRVESSEAMIQLSSLHVLLRRLAPTPARRSTTAPSHKPWKSRGNLSDRLSEILQLVPGKGER